MPKSCKTSRIAALFMGCAILAATPALAQSPGELGATSSASVHISLRIKPRISVADDGFVGADSSKRKCLAIWSRIAVLSLTRQNDDVIEVSPDPSCQKGSASGYSFSASQIAEKGTVGTVIVSPE